MSALVETKGPIGEAEKVSPLPDLRELYAAQQQTTALLGELGRALLGVQAQQEALAQRLERAEQGQAALLEALVGFRGILAQIVGARGL